MDYPILKKFTQSKKYRKAVNDALFPTLQQQLKTVKANNIEALSWDTCSKQGNLLNVLAQAFVDDGAAEEG